MHMSMLSLLLSVGLLSCAQGFKLLHNNLQVSGQRELKMAFNFFPPSSSIPSNKKLCVITGTTSGLGKETARALLNSNKYYVICACRDTEKMKEVAEKEGFDPKSHSVLELDLASFDSVRKFTTKLKQLKNNRPLDSLVCNAAVYQPALPTVRPPRPPLSTLP